MNDKATSGLKLSFNQALKSLISLSKVALLIWKAMLDPQLVFPA